MKLSKKKVKEHLWFSAPPQDAPPEILEPFMVHPRRRILRVLERLGVTSLQSPIQERFSPHECQDLQLSFFHLEEDDDGHPQLLWYSGWDDETQASHSTAHDEWARVWVGSSGTHYTFGWFGYSWKEPDQEENEEDDDVKDENV